MWTKEEAPRKWELQVAQTTFAKGFLSGRQGCVLALPADVPEKCFEMFGGLATWFHFAEQETVIWRRLVGKVISRVGKDVMVHHCDFFRMPSLVIAQNKIVVVDFDSMGNYHRSHYFGFRDLFHLRKLAQRSIIRWTFAQRGQSTEDIVSGITSVKRCAEDHGYKVTEEIPSRGYAEVRNGRKGTPMLTGQFHLERR